MSVGFNGHREQWETLWQETLQKCGDDPQNTLQVSVGALEAYPLDITFLFRAAADEERLADSKSDETAKEKHLQNALNYVGRLLKESPNQEVAKELLVRVYSKLGLDEMAMIQAHQCENVERALLFCLKGDNLRRHRQKILSEKLYGLLCEILCQDVQEEYPLDVCETILRLFFPDGNYQSFYHILESVYFKRAALYLQKGDETAAVDWLRKLFEITKATVAISQNQNQFTAPLLNLLENEAPFCNRRMYTDSFRFLLKRDFAGLENNEGFAELLNDVATYIAE